MTVKKLKEIIEDLPDDMKVLLTSDEEWNEIRECYESSTSNLLWDSNNREVYDKADLDEDDDYDVLEDCLILS